MLIASLILCGCVFSIWYAVTEDDGFMAFLGILLTGVVGFCLFMMSGLFYYPNQHTTIHKLKRLSSGSYVQIANDTYTFKVDGKVVVQNKDELKLTILGEDSTAKAKVTKDPGGFNHIGQEFEIEEYELRIPSDEVEKIS